MPTGCAEERARIEALEAALHKSWLYDGFECKICYGTRPWGTRLPVEHAADCIVLSLPEGVQA